MVNRAQFDLDRSWEATALGSRARLTFVEQGGLRPLFMLDRLEVFINRLGVVRAYRLGFEGSISANGVAFGTTLSVASIRPFLVKEVFL